MAARIEQHPLDARPITSGRHHFFGYYDKCSWNASGRYHLGLETGFLDRQPTRDDIAIVGMIDTHDGNRWIPIAETTAWSWQQGAMLQWLPSEPESTIVYNVREADRFHAVIHNVATGEKRHLPREIYAVGKTFALASNFARLHRARPGYGYPDGIDDTLPAPHPDDDGIFHIDLATGESRLLYSMQQLFEIDATGVTRNGPHWIQHLAISPEGSNFVFLQRCQFDPRIRFADRFFVSSPDGSYLRLVHNDVFSHFGYADEQSVVAWARTPGTERIEYAVHGLFDYRAKPFGRDVFSTDGHCSLSPDRRWMLTDTYPIDGHRTLILYELATGRRIDIGEFHSPAHLHNAIRCDLHPRWSRDGRQVSIDSAHTGQRQIYVLDVAAITAA